MRFTIHHFNLNNRTYNTFAIAKVEMYNDAIEVCKALAEANGEAMCVVEKSVRAIYAPGVGFYDLEDDESDKYDGVPADTGTPTQPPKGDNAMIVHTQTQVIVKVETLPNWRRESLRVLRWADNLPPGVTIQITCPLSRVVISVGDNRRIETATTTATKEWHFDGSWEYDIGVVSDSPTGQVLLAAVPHLFVEVPEPEWVPDEPYDGVPADTGSV